MIQIYETIFSFEMFCFGVRHSVSSHFFGLSTIIIVIIVAFPFLRRRLDRTEDGKLVTDYVDEEGLSIITDGEDGFYDLILKDGFIHNN
jgi:hypothetical protein